MSLVTFFRYINNIIRFMRNISTQYFQYIFVSTHFSHFHPSVSPFSVRKSGTVAKTELAEDSEFLIARQ